MHGRHLTGALNSGTREEGDHAVNERGDTSAGRSGNPASREGPLGAQGRRRATEASGAAEATCAATEPGRRDSHRPGATGPTNPELGKKKKNQKEK